MSDEIEISFITDQVLTTRENTTEVINSNASTISLTNDSQADVGELLLIDNELLYVESKNGTQYNVTRGYLNTCLLYTSPSPRERQSRMPSSA